MAGAVDRRGIAVLALLLLVTLCWPVQELSGGILARNGHHLAQVVGFRYVSHLLILCLVFLPRGGLGAFATSRPGLQLLRGLCMFGMPAGYILASRFTGNAWIWTIFWLAPTLIVVGASLLLAEKAPRVAWMAVLIGAVGAAVTLAPTPGGLEGTLLAMVMSGSFAGYVVLSRELRGERLAASLFYTAVGALAPMLPFIARAWTPVTTADVVPALFTGLLSLVILGILDAVAEAGPVWRIAVILPIVPLWESVLSLFVRGGPLDMPLLVGGAIVLVAAGIGARLLVVGTNGFGNVPVSRIVDYTHG
jgi:drug/metabolite transporter (DMT)-like permease